MMYFPGVVQMTPCFWDEQHKTWIWYVIIRHADHEDIIRHTADGVGDVLSAGTPSGGGGGGGPGTGTGGGTMIRRSTSSGGSGGGSGGANNAGRIPYYRKGSGSLSVTTGNSGIAGNNVITPVITINEDGIIQDFALPKHIWKIRTKQQNKLVKQKEEQEEKNQSSSSPMSQSSASASQQQQSQEDEDLDPWSWITKDVIGQHITQAHPPPQQQQQQQQSTTSQYPPGVLPPRKPGQSMLDVILENKLDPGHPATPFSGYVVRPQMYDTALTTGNAIREENITEAAFEAALDPIFQINEHGIIQMVNSAATTVFGWKRSEFIGSNVRMICGENHGSKHDQYMARYLATGDTRVIGQNRRLQAKKKKWNRIPNRIGRRGSGYVRGRRAIILWFRSGRIAFIHARKIGTRNC